MQFQATEAIKIALGVVNSMTSTRTRWKTSRHISYRTVVAFQVFARWNGGYGTFSVSQKGKKTKTQQQRKEKPAPF